MAGFVGRKRELASLERELDRVRTTRERPGRCLLVSGRRRVGKSRLVEEFCARSNDPHVFFAASQRKEAEVGLFVAEVAQSDLPGRVLLAGTNPDSWEAAMRLVAAGIADDVPTIVVLDEFPYLVAGDPALEATFQKLWDQVLSNKPVLLVLIGSDLAMMESLNDYDRAFHQRGTELVVPPLSPVEVGEITGASDAAAAFDAYLITGGLPLICEEWPTGISMWEYLEEALREQVSALVVSGERALAAEFPTEALARVVLGEIGAGERTFTNIARASGGLQASSANRALELLALKRVVARDVPLSTKASKEARYRVSDSYLRFWLRFVGTHTGEIERGRGDLTIDRIRRDWTQWRGRAIEPVVREALMRLTPVDGLPPAEAVGGFWTRANDPEIDVIGADRSPVAKRIAYAGTIKWLDNATLDQGDLDKLAGDIGRVPGADERTPLVAISRNGVSATGAASNLGPDDLINAWI